MGLPKNIWLDKGGKMKMLKKDSHHNATGLIFNPLVRQFRPEVISIESE
jgi:hypothetical protein